MNTLLKRFKLFKEHETNKTYKISFVLEKELS